MSAFNTINFLPSIFRSETNQRFLGATLDQLIPDSQLNIRLDGYIGRTFAPTYKVNNTYISEITKNRQNYQLEPSVVVKDQSGTAVFNAGYLDLLNGISRYNGFTNNHQRLFKSESYNYDGKFNYDKFVNYTNYFWMPNGPDTVSVYINQTPYSANYAISRSNAENGYVVSGLGDQPNPQITVARGGSYTFQINQPGRRFWIQSQPGITGTDPNLPNVTTRQVAGVTNNGIDSGNITFNVPTADSQDFFIKMTVNQVDLATTVDYVNVQNSLLSTFLAKYPNGFDGITSPLVLQNKIMVFINNDVDDSFWTTPTVVAPYTSLDKSPITAGSVISSQKRVNGWQISLVSTGTNDYIIQLKPTVTVANLQKVFILSGKTYASTQYWVDNNYRFQPVPIITANDSYLYYQDETDPNFFGTIKIVDNIATPINVTTDIIGSKGYTSPNGVVFTNGMKIAFDISVVPSYYANNQYYVDGVGTSISLTAVSAMVVPESFGANIATTPDYIVINRGSQDLNAWTRGNRWFHRDALTAAATYNKTAINYGPNIVARRPIIEFDSGLQLFNYGHTAIASNIDIIVFTGTHSGQTDAFVDIEGQTTAIVDGVTLLPGMRIIFANDYDSNVTNKIWQVNIDTIGGQEFIRLTDVGIPISAGQNFIPSKGGNGGKTYRFTGAAWVECQEKSTINQPPLFDLFDANGYSFSDTTVYNDSTFIGTRAFGYQVGTGTNDAVLGFPLSYQSFQNIGDIVFENYYDTDLFTANGETINCNSGYFKLNFNNSSTIVNNWVIGVESTEQYQIFSAFFDGHFINSSLGMEIPSNNPVPPSSTIDLTQNFAFIQVDVLPENQQSVPYLKVFVNNKLKTPGTDYFIINVGIYYAIALTTFPNVGDKIDALIYTNYVSNTGYYEIPENLDLNPLNQTFEYITLGQVRTHYNKLIENRVSTKALQDSYIKQQGGTIVQHRAPVTYAATFLNDENLNFVDGITLAQREYIRFKNKFVSLCMSIADLNHNDPIGGVDKILQNINAVKNNTFPWYYSDMVPQGSNYSVINYSVLNARQVNYEINSIFDITALSNRAVLIYVNGTQCVYGLDYIFSSRIPAVTFLRKLNVGDSIQVRDYANTDGNYIPETPTKLGLYPKFQPLIYTDSSYQTPTEVLRGHDGSLTPLYNDFRDSFLLELESRIYNNIKTNYDSNSLDIYDVIPGRFRTTDYTLTEFTQLLTRNFLQWVGINKVDYTTNTWYDQNNPWTINYAQVSDIIDGSPLQGSWRAIYNYWFDTDTPNTTPWEMLGFSNQPIWWVTRYGPAPYTAGNLTLWQDLASGYVWNNGDPYTDSRFVRTGLINFIPVDSAGNLRSPKDSLVSSSMRNSKISDIGFAVGHQGPVENAWRRSSDYPFSLQIALALARPAEYFSTQYDTSRFKKNPITRQFSNVANQKITANILEVNGDTTTGSVIRTSGYVNWIADSIKNLGIDPVFKIKSYTKNLNMQLSYKLGGYTDKNLISVASEQTSPGSTNDSVIIPDDNYQIYFNKSVPIGSVSYSAVIVQKTEIGYQVRGYDTETPFFIINPSIANNNYGEVSGNTLSAKLYNDGSGNFTAIPYGTNYATVQQLVDFLISYERYMTGIGFVFNQFNSDLQTNNDFALSAREFLYWVEQGWAIGSVLLLNPVVNTLVFYSTYSVVDQITNAPNQGRLLDENFKTIASNAFNILRDTKPITTQGTIAHTKNNVFGVNIVDGRNVCYAKLNLVQFEHSLIFDNTTDFNDIIYVPNQGVRQYRLKLTGTKSGLWTGALSAPGYIYSQPEYTAWQVNKDYRIGDIVTFNSLYYTAKNNIVASTTFNFSDWIQIHKSDLQSGLLPSFGHNAQQFVNFYDVDIPPQDENMQLFSAGLIGFRQRGYMTDLGISIANQTKFYQGYIKQKGTLNSINALTKANFDNVLSQLNVYEEWAFRVGQYGDLTSNAYREYILDQSVFKSNPISVLQTPTYTHTTGNLIVGLTAANVYNSNSVDNLSSSLYTNRTNDYFPTDLVTPGYVNVNDVNIQIFDISKVDYNSILNFGTGYTLWVAKNPSNNWDVYRLNETALQASSISYVLDNYAQIIFNYPHNFVAGDLFILSGFTTESGNFNNLYEVINVPNQNSVTIIVTNVGNSVNYLIKNSPVIATGTIHKLQSQRIPTFDFVANIVPSNGWRTNDKVWVDDNGVGNWGVYTYNVPWASNAMVPLSSSGTTNAKFGSTVTIGQNNQFVYTGSPGENKFYYANVSNSFNSTAISNVEAGFGRAIASVGNLVVVGSNSNVHIYRHEHNGTPVYSGLLVGGVGNDTGVNGTINGLAMSSDQQWLYIGSGDEVIAFTGANTTFPNIAYSRIYNISLPGKSGSGFGNTIVSYGANVIIGAPTDTSAGVQKSGQVFWYQRTGTTFNLKQTIAPHYKTVNGGFGTSLAVDGTGGNLYIGEPGSSVNGFINGVVERWVLNSGSYAFNQTISHPNNEIGSFGVSLGVTSDTNVLAVGSLGSPGQEITTFDNTLLTIDSGTIQFIDKILNSGAAYVFERISDSGIGKYHYVQELEAQVHTGDLYGSSLAVTPTLIAVGAPNKKPGGGAYAFTNPTAGYSWTLTRYQQPRVDINSISRTFIYDKTNNNILTSLDYFDPAKGKLLAFGLDIDYYREHDPALYNQGTFNTNKDLNWGPQQVGKIWWDLSVVRYVDYEQDSIDYRLANWGRMFDGSQVFVYEWVESLVPPSQYAGVGYPRYADDSAYSTYGYVDNTGAVTVKYYFWVAELDTVNVDAGKTNSVYGITAAIMSPQSQNLSYIAALRDDAIAIYNASQHLVAQNSVLHIGSKSANSRLFHSEYALIQEGNPHSQIPKFILNKLIDSLAGQDSLGNAVPDHTLSPAQAYGINIRPRQSMFINRKLALQNYFDAVNTLLLTYPVVERKVLTTLNSSEVAPNDQSGNYQVIVNTIQELGFIDTNLLSVGNSVLVNVDSTNGGKWAIYTLNSSKEFVLTRVQQYKTNNFWKFVDWYDSSYDPTRAPDVTVDTRLDFGKLTLVAGTYVKILNVDNQNFAVYYIDSTLTANLVGIQNGTIQITVSFFDSNDQPINQLELRNILIAMQNDIFVDDIASEFNQIFFYLIKYALTEQKNLDWVFKTSFLSATQYIRKLLQFPVYIADNQNYYLDYINEVKPYRTVLRDFIVDYVGNDTYDADITDFDLPPYWDSVAKLYRSPSGEQYYDSTTLSSGIYTSWNNNYKYSVTSVIIENAGRGFQSVPSVSFTGGGGTGASAVAVLDSTGAIAQINIVSGGTGYTSAPTVIINGTGTGAKVFAVIRNVYSGSNTGHNLIRNVNTTLKFDRVNYTPTNTFISWDTITSANIGQTILANTVILYNQSVYQVTVNSIIDSGVNFPYANVVLENIGNFNNASDRITAFDPSINLASVMAGIEYSGVFVDANTYVGSIWDSTIQSKYTDSVGVNPADIIVDGGNYVDSYNSHAPEEFVPGQTFDSLNIKVFTANTQTGQNQYAFRIFGDMSANTFNKFTYTRISNDATTTLATDLLLTDSNIYVTNASVLPTPSPELSIPGVVFINGEKIHYYSIDYTNNVLSRIRRCVDGTGFNIVDSTPWQIATIYENNSFVSYGGNTYVTTGNVYAKNVHWRANVDYSVNSYISYNGGVYYTTGNVYGSYFNDILSNVIYRSPGNNSGFVSISGNLRLLYSGNINQRHLTGTKVVDSSLAQAIIGSDAITVSNIGLSSVTVQSANVAVGNLQLRSSITANIGDYLTQLNYDLTVAANFKVMSNCVSSKYVAVLPISGTLTSSPGNAVVINGTTAWTPQTDYPINSYVTHSGIAYIVTGNVFGSSFTSIYSNLANVANVSSYNVVGTVSSTGTVTIPANTVVTQSNIWYSHGAGTATDGTGLANSKTIESVFLLSSPGYTP